MKDPADNKVVGARVPRVEDPRLLTGRGHYVDDIQLPGMLHAAFVRSHIAHGRVLSVDAGAARDVPGVALVLTAIDLDGVVDEFRPYGPPTLAAPSYRALADGKVRVTGEPLAIVVAETRAIAEDACELVVVDIDPLPVVTTISQALDRESVPLFDELGTNVMFHREDRYGDPEDAFARADRVVSAHFEQQRMANVPLEGRACVADFRLETNELVIDVAHQNPHALRARSRRCSTIPRSSSPCGVATSAARSARRRTRAVRSCHSAPRRACSADR